MSTATQMTRGQGQGHSSLTVTFNWPISGPHSLVVTQPDLQSMLLALQHQQFLHCTYRVMLIVS